MNTPKLHPHLLAATLLALVLTAGCSQAPAAAPASSAGGAPEAALTEGTTGASSTNSDTPPALPFEGQTLRVMTHDSFAASDAVLATFEAQTGAKLQILQSGDAGSTVNKAVLALDAPLADVLYGVDNTFLSRALEAGIFEPYQAPALASVSADLKLDPANGALPVDYADVCLNYDRTWFEARDLAPPERLEDLAKPAYKGLLVVQNPATSSPGLAFLITTVARVGEDGYLDYWRSLVENDLLVVNDWETAWNTEFSGGPGGGTRPIVVSYASSPAFEVLYGANVTEPSTAAVTADGACFRQVEYVGILQGTQQRALAEAWVDFMLSPVFQRDMPTQMFVFPVVPDAPLEDVFQRLLVVPRRTANVGPADIAAHRERWIREWTAAVLR